MTRSLGEGAGKGEDFVKVQDYESPWGIIIVEINIRLHVSYCLWNEIYMKAVHHNISFWVFY